MPWLVPDAHTQVVEAAQEIVLHRPGCSAVPRAALTELLERKGVDPRVVSEILDRLKAAGVIDDAAYAARLTCTHFTEKGAARQAIAEELRRKGLDESDVAKALEQISSEDEDSAVLTLVRKKLSATGHPPWEVCRRRIAAVLERRGYSWEMTMRAITKVLAEEQPRAEPMAQEPEDLRSFSLKAVAVEMPSTEVEYTKCLSQALRTGFFDRSAFMEPSALV